MALDRLTEEAATGTRSYAAGGAAIGPAEIGFEQIRATIDGIELWPVAPVDQVNQDPEAGPQAAAIPAATDASITLYHEAPPRVMLESVDLELPTIHGIDVLSGIPLLQMTSLGF